MLILDCETSSKLRSELVPADQQPEITELAMLKLDDATLAETDALSFLVRPLRLPMDPEVVKVTRITEAMVVDQPSFARQLPRVIHFVLGERTLVAHNASFDVTVLALEVQRLGMTHRFPWPPEHIDTVELTMDLPAPRQKSARLKLGELYRVCMGMEMPTAHRALDDTRHLAEIVRHLRQLDGRI